MLPVMFICVIIIENLLKFVLNVNTVIKNAQTSYLISTQDGCEVLTDQLSKVKLLVINEHKSIQQLLAL